MSTKRGIAPATVRPRSLIAARVTAVHGILLLIVFVFFQLQSCSDPEPQLTKVKIVTSLSLPPAGNEPETNPAPPADRPAQQVPNPYRPPKTVSVPRPSNKSTRNTSQSPPQEKSAAPSPRKYRTADEIRQSKLRSVSSQDQPAPIANTQFDESDFRRRLQLKDASNSQSFSEPDTSENEYHQEIISKLYRLWDQPSRTEVAMENPEVTIRLEIHRSGKIISQAIVSRSNVLPMDNSVSRMLQDLKKFPAFPDRLNKDSIKTDVRLRLTDE